MSVLERLLHRDRHDRHDRDGRHDGGSGFTIAPMRKRDLRQGVLVIEASAYPVGWSHNVFVSELDQMRSGSRYYAVARQGTEIVGYAGLWFAVDEAHVTNVAVAPAARRNGVARQLMLHLADIAIDRGCVGWTLEVRITSDGAQRLYEEFGFESAGIRQKYYDNVEDAIVMWCHEIQGEAYRSRLSDIEEAARVE